MDATLCYSIVELLPVETLAQVLDECDVVTQYVLRLTCKDLLRLGTDDILLPSVDLVFSKAALLGEKKLLQWFVDTHPSLLPSTEIDYSQRHVVESAAMSGSVMCLQWTISTGYNFYAIDALCYAAQEGEYDTFAYLFNIYRDKILCDSETSSVESKTQSILYRIIKGSNLDILDSFVSHYPSSLDLGCVDYAAMFATVPMFLRICREVGVEEGVRHSYKKAARCGNTSVLRYLLDTEGKFIEKKVKEIVEVSVRKDATMYTAFWVKDTFPEYFKKGGETLKVKLTRMMHRGTWEWRMSVLDSLFK